VSAQVHIRALERAYDSLHANLRHRFLDLPHGLILAIQQCPCIARIGYFQDKFAAARVGDQKVLIAFARQCRHGAGEPILLARRRERLRLSQARDALQRDRTQRS